jgi:hypothetical protein
MEKLFVYYTGLETSRVRCGWRLTHLTSEGSKWVRIQVNGKPIRLRKGVWELLDKKETEDMDITKYTGKGLVALYNANNPPNGPITRFATRGVAEKRVLALLDENKTPLYEAAVKAGLREAAPEPVKTTKADKPKADGPTKPRLTIHRDPRIQKEILPCREGSNQATAVDLLAREGGASLEELAEGLASLGRNIQPETVRSTVSWDVCAVKGYGCRAEEDRYYLVLPQGMTAPLPHTPRKGGK